MAETEKLLYLYSSNIRPLYEQDILDLIAHPAGALYRFRYFKRYLSPELTTAPKAMIDMPALVNFSIQDPGQYHEPAFVPVRYATVMDIEDVGDVLVIVLRLGAYCALNRPADFRKPDLRGAMVKQYTQALAAVPHPYQYSAGIGTPPGSAAQVDSSSDTAHLFESLVQFLQGTQSFQEARFYRIRGISKLSRHGQEKDPISIDDHGVFELAGGETYSVDLHHFQGSETVGRSGFSVEADGTNVRVIGKPGFEIASRYDVFGLEVHAVEPPTNESRETVISIDPAEGVKGPSVRLRVRVTKPLVKTAAAIIGATIVAFLLGLPTLLPSLSQGWKMFAVIAATVATGLLATYGLKRV
jgi:hypothetical protein